MDPSAPAPEMGLDAAGLTDVGLVRSTNEDAFLIATLQRSMVVHDASPGASGWFSGEPAGMLLVVADGMGGHGGGEVASRTAVNAVSNYLLNVMPWLNLYSNQRSSRASMPGVREELSSALVAGDETVKAAGANAGSPRMGTTLTMALVLWPLLYVAHVGDTRCYLLHGRTLKRLTTDHNLAEKLAGADGQLETAEHLQNILWNSLGGSNEIPQPELAKVQLEAGDTLLLCSDGLNKHLTDEQIQSVLEEPESSAARASKLLQMANAEGGTDNITAIVAQVHQLARNA